MIDMKLVRTNVFTRWPCDVCGGCTEKVEFLCEGRDTNNGYGVRVCECCLEAGQDQIDNRLREHILDRELATQWLRDLIGQLKIPAFEEWQRAQGYKPPVHDPWEALIPGRPPCRRVANSRDHIIDDDIPF